MSKKAMLLAVVASMAMFALPAAASAVELHMEGIEKFTGSGGAGTLAATGEPTITCEKTDVTNGVVSAGGTTATMGLDFTGCHTTVFGLTAKCRTTGSALDNTILSSGTVHFITATVVTENQVKHEPGAFVTPATTTIVCAGISSVTVEGNIIGTITAPACGVSSKTLTVSFAATGSTQNHKLFTGIEYDLTAQTSGGSKLTAGLTSTATLESATAGKINCT